MQFRGTTTQLTFTTVIAIVLVLCFISPVSAQGESEPTSKKDSTWHDWNVRIAPYVWILGVQGQIAIKPNPAQLPELPPPPTTLPSGYSIYDIDISFQEIIHSLKFALMLSGHYNHKRFVTQFNISSLVLESDAIAPFDFLLQNNTLRLSYAGGEFGFGYKAVKKERFILDLLVGMKFI